jgi:hypothetical protein
MEIRAIVGGVDYTVGGLGKYEIRRRAIRYKYSKKYSGGIIKEDERPKAYYKDKKHIQPDDVVKSILSIRWENSALHKAAIQLAELLKNLESGFCNDLPDSVIIPSLTSATLYDFAKDSDQSSHLDILYKISNNVEKMMNGLNIELQPLPEVTKHKIIQSVDTTDDKEVLKLEKTMKPYIAELERLQAALAVQLDIAAKNFTKISRKVCKNTKKLYPITSNDEVISTQTNLPSVLPTRGIEVDEAAAQVPTMVLNTGLPWKEDGKAFDIRDGVIVPTDPSDGIYFGIANRDDPARTSLLTPQIAVTAAFKTSGRMYAWYILDSPEGCYAIRALPKNGYSISLNINEIIEWLKLRLTGNPPHKIKATEYTKFLRKLGLEIHEGPLRNDGTMRFNLIDTTTLEERMRDLSKLRSLTENDFNSLDWSLYDRDASSAACSRSHEVAGDVIIDLTQKTVTAPKVRSGTIWGAHPHYRSYITFHTHPSVRYQGSHAEPPSPADIQITLEACALDIMAWAFISAPEGTYIVRPSQLIILTYLRDPQSVLDNIQSIYTDSIHECLNSTIVCCGMAINSLKEIGFIAYLRNKPCIPLLPVPDLFPMWNRERRDENRAAYARLVKTSAEKLFTVDWDPAIIDSESPTIRAATWLTCSLDGDQVSTNGIGHFFGAVDDIDSYPHGIPGPLLIIYFPEEDNFPIRIPYAALKAARKNIALWAWVIFLSPTRITVFRARVNDVEIHGPTNRINSTIQLTDKNKSIHHTRIEM